jgi:hypothetical protein
MTMMPEFSSMTILAGLVGLDNELLDIGQQIHDVAIEIRSGSVQPDGCRILGGGRSALR